jgi:nucleoporin p58/p45
MFSTLNQPQAQPFGMFSGGLLGGGLGQSNNQQTVPGVRIDTASIRGTTRFNDLHEDLQKQIINMDEVIQAQIRLKNDCDAIMPSHEAQLLGIPHDVDFIRRKLIGVDNALTQDAEAINAAQELIKIDAEHAKLSFKAIDNLKLPPQYHNPGIWSAKSTSNDSRSQINGEGEAQDLIGFFSTTADEQAKALEKYQKHMTDIEQHLRSVEASSAQQINSLITKRNGGFGGQDDPVQELAAILRELEQSILGVAGKVGSAREAMQTLQLGTFTGPADEKKTNGKRNGVY